MRPGLLALALWVSAFASSALAQTICKRALVPNGYVIIGETFLPGCSLGGGGMPNAWILHPAQDPELEICRESPIPTGYMIVANAVDRPLCPRRPGAQYNAYVIRIPWEQEIVCRENRIDERHFRIVRPETTFACSDVGMRDNAYLIERRGRYRAFCSGRIDGPASGAWRLYYDVDYETPRQCAERLAEELRAAGGQRMTITYGEYDDQARVEVELDCTGSNQSYVSGTGKAGWDQAMSYIRSSMRRHCLVKPRSFPYDTWRL